MITVLMIVFAAIMLIESWYLLSHRKTGIFGQAATERSFRHCSIHLGLAAADLGHRKFDCRILL